MKCQGLFGHEQTLKKDLEENQLLSPSERKLLHISSGKELEAFKKKKVNLVGATSREEKTHFLHFHGFGSVVRLHWEACRGSTWIQLITESKHSLIISVSVWQWSFAGEESGAS